MDKSKYIRNFFAGGNTAYGFYSLYEHILGNDGERMIILKGGPGTGKSTLLKKIGNSFLQKGFRVEFFYCSSDSDSLDGVAIPALNAAVVDGTAPHVIEPVIPGAYDEIINLGEYWDESKLIPYRSEIKYLSETIKGLFRDVYHCLAEAKLIMDHLKTNNAAIIALAKVNAVTDNLLEKLFAKEKHQGKISRERHLFGSAITPAGVVNHYPSIVKDCREIYLLTGNPGTGKSTLLERIYLISRQKGFDIEVYRCGLDPQKIDALVLCQKKTAIIRVNEHHSLSHASFPCLMKERVLSTSHFIDAEAYRESASFRRDYQEIFTALLAKAVANLKKAKQTHLKRESFYANAMDYTRAEKAGKEITAKLLALL
ncbi:MAG TPA: hypothetical protein GX697_04530 [Firmicutes bacterium]|nr:hypothetical protein [Bacillota bacterium]